MTQADFDPVVIEPVDAWQKMQTAPAVLLLDVRSDMEYLMIGHPTGALNAAWIEHPASVASKLNSKFVAQVRKLMLGRISGHSQGAVSLILICRSGNRSLAAAKALMAEGIENVHIVSGGFEGPIDDDRHRSTVAGWRYSGLPWEQC